MGEEVGEWDSCEWGREWESRLPVSGGGSGRAGFL